MLSVQQKGEIVLSLLTHSVIIERSGFSSKDK